MKYINPLYQNIASELKLAEVLNIEIIQTLWSGYGELVRLKFKDKTIIVKHVNLPKPSEHPRGWNTNLSHKRKLHSYKVEVNWYEEFSKSIDNRCHIPKGLMCFQTQNEWLIVMEDLSSVGFTNIVTKANKIHLKASLSWLANFHARYMNTNTKLLWENGTYWHLETRPDEFEILEDKRLKYFAKIIDSELKNSKYITLVHGDAKLANFCFSDDGTRCAAVDFQYVGHGCAMKDLVYFMSSSIKAEDCQKIEKWFLNTYFELLKKALAYYQPKIDSYLVEKEYRRLFSIAGADFQRFIKGWSPNHFKINTYSEELTLKALNYLESKYQLN